MKRGRLGAKVIARRAKRSGRWIDQPSAHSAKPLPALA
jgi:hypothetical protein